MTATASATNQNTAAHEFVDKTADKIHKLINNAGAEIGETTDAISERLKISPLASLAVALGAGIVLDRMIRTKPATVAAGHAYLPALVTGVAAIGQTAATQVMYRHMLANTARMAALGLFGAMLATAGAIGGLYAFYLFLLTTGLSALAAVVAVSATAFALAGLVLIGAGRAMRRMNAAAFLLPAAAGARGMVRKLMRELKDAAD